MWANKYHIDVPKAIGKLLPFYVRGRKLTLLLEAILQPINSLHKVWLEWAQEKIIEASITSQPMSLTWYLNHKFRDHFADQNDSFYITDGVGSPTNIIFTEREYKRSDEYSKHVYMETEGMESVTMNIWNYGEILETYAGFVVIAPKPLITSIYGEDEYKHEITRIINKYNTSFSKYQLTIK